GCWVLGTASGPQHPAPSTQHSALSVREARATPAPCRTGKGIEDMAVDTQLRASEIKNVLLGEIERYDQALGAEQVGEVLEVTGGIARIYGLMGTMASEMLEI